MGTGANRGGKIEYLKEGFIVHWDDQLLTIEVIDYHATMLRLPWKDVQALATIATGASSPQPARPRTKRPPASEA
jgi:hypothetical protein